MTETKQPDALEDGERFLVNFSDLQVEMPPQRKPSPPPPPPSPTPR